MTNKQLIGFAVVLVVIAGLTGHFYHPKTKSPLAGATNQCASGQTCLPSIELTGAAFGSTNTLQIDGGAFVWGTNGSRIDALVAGSCTIWSPNTTIGASSTDQVVCQGATNGGITALTGVTADSICNVTNASSTNTTSNSIVVAGVSASSTAGTIVLRLSNLTGTTFTWSSTASSSSKWQYSCIDPS